MCIWKMRSWLRAHAKMVTWQVGRNHFFELINWGETFAFVTSDRCLSLCEKCFIFTQSSLLCSPFHALKTLGRYTRATGLSWPWIFTSVNISIMIAIFSAVRSNVCTGRHASQHVVRMDSLFYRAWWQTLKS